MAQLITMTPKELSRYGIIQRLIRKEINGTDASLQMRLTIRQIKNIKARVVTLGAQGIIHQSRGRSGNRKLDEQVVEKTKTILKENYRDFGPTFASEKLFEINKIKINKETVRQIMIGLGLWRAKEKKKNKQYRHWRERKEQYGQMEQFDGSYHHWFEDRGEECCLLASIDDATSKITGLHFTDSESVKNAFGFWKRYVEQKGKPLSIYLDRHSTYKQNQKSVFDDEKSLTQFEKTMELLGIKVIHAKCPQGKGRIERLFDTLQDRLVKELRLAGISTMEEANTFVNETFIEKFNKQFSVLPTKKGDLHLPLTEFEKNNFDSLFSVKNYRLVNNDFTVRFKGCWYQLESSQPTLVRPKEKVCIEERISGQLYLCLKGKNLNYRLLPKRPEKITKIPIIALVKSKPSWRPPPNHPWRKPLILTAQKS